MSYAFVSSASVNTGSLTSFVISAGQNVLVIGQDASNSGSTLTLSDGTNTYVSRGTIFDPTGGITQTLFDCLSPTPGTYTLTLSGATGPGITALRYTGLASFSASSFVSHDYQTFSPSTATDAMTTTAITPSALSAMIFGASFMTATNADLAVGTGFTKRVGRDNGGGQGQVIEDLRLNAGSVSNIASFTASAGAQLVTVLGAAYIETGAGVGSSLISDGRDLLNSDNRFNYIAPATVDWIHVGSTGAFCNLNSGGNPAFALFSTSFTADQQAQVSLVSSVTNAFAGIGVRLSAGASGPNGYFAWFDAARYNIGVANNGVLTTLIGGPQLRTSNVGDIFLLSVQGSTITLTVNGTTLRTVTDTTVTSGNPGLVFNGTHPSTVIDLFRAGSLGTNLSGLTTSSILGQISEIVSYKPTAQTGSFTVGAPTDALTLTLAGQTASFAEGSLVFVENIAGQTATFAEGVITASTGGNVTVNAGAQSLQMAQGQLFDFISYVLDQGANVAQLFSQTATFAQGNLLAEADYFPPAFTVIPAEGVATSALDNFLGSLTFTSSEGSITATAGANFNKTFSAQTLASSEGVINLEADYFPLAQTLALTEGTITFSSAGDFTVTLSGTFGAFVSGAMVPSVVTVIPITPVGVYPNLAGLILDEATQQLEVAGAIVPASIGYFGTWPITVNWVPSQVSPFVVLSQSIPPLAPIVANAPIRLTVSQPSENVAYP